MATHIINQISGYENVMNIIELKGVDFQDSSLQKKYLVTTSKNYKEIINIISLQSLEDKMVEAEILKQCKKLGVPVTIPTRIEQISDELAYTISPYIEGDDVGSVCTDLNEVELYQLGFEAGKYLRKMHQIAAPITLPPWHERSMAKHNRYVIDYKNCGFLYPDAEKINIFIENHKGALEQRPSTFQHDDYHLRNIITKDKKIVGIIDFDNRDYGDPYFDFVKLGLFTRNKSIDFAVGQVMGYFENNIPDDFWLLYSIYCGMTVFSSIVWSLRVFPSGFANMIEKLNTLVDDHDCFEQTVPKWFAEYLFE